MSHPAKFSPQVLVCIKPLILEIGLPVHDPFAGTGERLGALCDELGVVYTGSEIEPEYIKDDRVVGADSTRITSYPFHDHMIVTSPVYPNGMTDHFHAQDDSKRHTYRQGLAAILGYDRPLKLNNMGRYGNRYRRSLASELTHFGIAEDCVEHWPTHAIVNVKNVVASSYTVDVIGKWKDLLAKEGFRVSAEIEIATPGQRHGANGDLRADHEAVIVAARG